MTSLAAYSLGFVRRLKDDAMAAQDSLRRPVWRTYLTAVLLVALLIPVGWLVEGVVSPAAVPLAFLAAVLGAAIYGGVGEALFASFISYVVYVLMFDRVGSAPTVHSVREMVTVSYFLVFAITVGLLAARLRRQLEEANLAADRAELLSRFARQASSASTEQETADIIVGFVARSVSTGAALLRRGGDDELAVLAAAESGPSFGPAERQAALWAIRYRTSAGWSTGAFGDARWLFIPLAPERGEVTLLAIARDERSDAMSASERQLIATLADQALVLMQRARLMAETVEARQYLETERLRSALLSSVSHDLRTPLATIIGAATTLEALGDRLTPENRVALANSIAGQSQRLNRYIQNLLDMTRLGRGMLHAEAEWVDLRDVIASARERTQDSLSGHAVSVRVPDAAAFARADDTLLEQALVNLLDNAGKYGRIGGPIEIEAAVRDGFVRISVGDDGPGVPQADRQRIFEPFYRLGEAGDCGPSGSGLGLSIARGFARAMGGEVQAGERRGGGARFDLTIPAFGLPVLDTNEDGPPVRLEEPHVL